MLVVAGNHDENSGNVEDFVVADTIVAVTADVKSKGTVWFVKVIDWR